MNTGKTANWQSRFPHEYWQKPNPHSVRGVKAATRPECLLGRWGIVASESEQNA